MESWARVVPASGIVPSLAPYHPEQHNTAKRVALPWQIPKTLPPYNLKGALRQRNMDQMKEQFKTPESELSDEETDNLSDIEFKTLVIRMLTELTELGRKMKAT